MFVYAPTYPVVSDLTAEEQTVRWTAMTNTDKAVTDGFETYYPLENRKVDKYHTLVRLSDTKIKRHIKIRSEANPYDADWKDFFDQYKTRRMLAHLDGKQYIYRLWNQQMQCCPVCGKHITRETPWKITEMTGSSRKAKVLIHDHCSRITNRNKWKLL